MRSPRVLTRSFPLMSAVFTVKRFRTVIGLRLVKQSYPRLQPLYGFCPSDQSFASAFLQIPPRDGHPWLWLYPSHCRADSGLSPVRTCARRAHSQNPRAAMHADFLYPYWEFPFVFRSVYALSLLLSFPAQHKNCGNG